MPADPTAIVTAARQRRELTRAKAIQALRELDHAGTPITFEVVARAARVSRSWLYAQPDIRTEIQRLRDATRRAPTPPIPAAQRASADSLRRRLESAHERIRKLTEDNQRLRRQLAQALGEGRQAHPSTKPATARPNASSNVALQ
jgi:small-conductance mechanosensitive channel